MNPLIEEFKKFGTISAQAEMDFHQRTIRQERKKGSFYLKEGQNTSGLFIIEKGSARIFYTKNHKEINTLFALEGEVVASANPIFWASCQRKYSVLGR